MSESASFNGSGPSSPPASPQVPLSKALEATGSTELPRGWVDIHTHLNFLKISPEKALASARAAGIARCITIGTEPGDHGIVLDLAQRYFPEVACTLGVHPHEAGLFDAATEAWIERMAPRPEVVAIGEIGLDYYYETSPREAQKEAFRQQLALAERLGLPVEIHTRDAEADTVEILRDWISGCASKDSRDASRAETGRARGVLHCFTGTRWLAEQALALGLDISISGVATFKNAEDLRATIGAVPLDRLHLETDAPFLAPVPMRGKPNEPAYLAHTARVVAQVKGVSEEQLLEATRANARRLFPKLR